MATLLDEWDLTRGWPDSGADPRLSSWLPSKTSHTDHSTGPQGSTSPHSTAPSSGPFRTGLRKRDTGRARRAARCTHQKPKEKTGDGAREGAPPGHGQLICEQLWQTAGGWADSPRHHCPGSRPSPPPKKHPMWHNRTNFLALHKLRQNPW